MDMGGRYKLKLQLLAFGRANAVYKYNNCVHRGAVATFYSLQHNGDNYSASFAQWGNLLATAAKSYNHMYVICTSISIEF